MNILNVLRFSPESGGGILHHLIALGKLTQTNGHKLFIGLPKERPWHKELQRFSEVIIMPEIETPIRSGFPTVLKMICNKNNIDVIHFHFSFALPFSLALQFKNWNIPVIFHWHNPPAAFIELLTPNNSIFGKAKRFLSTRIAIFTDKRIISQHISISREISNLLIQYKWTIESKIRFLINGVNIKTSNGNIKTNEKDKVPVIGTVANFRPQKDHQTLVKAFAILFNKGINSELWLIGDGDLKSEIENLVKQMGIESKVRFVGQIANTSDYYQKMDIFILSTHYEGHPLSIIEAMSFGLPVVATKISSIPEIISNGVNGLLVNPHDPEALAKAIQSLIEDNQLANRLAAEGRKYIEKQPTIEDWAERVLNIYGQCLNEKN